MKLSPTLKFVPLAVAGYMLAWGLAYVAMMLSRGDRPAFRECYEYFILAWTFQAGELPGFIWLFSLVGFALMAGIFTLVLLIKGRQR